MAWYHWIAAYIIIIAGAAFVVLPNKTLLLALILGGIIAITIFVAGRLPAKEDKYVDKGKEP